MPESCPPTTNSTIRPMPYRMVPTPPMMSNNVKTCPARESGCTSPKPTVKMVVTVM